jgi:hypothetical protein
MKLSAVVFLLAIHAFAGQSVVLTANNATIAQRGSITPPHSYRIEAYLHDWTDSWPSHPAYSANWSNGFLFNGYAPGLLIPTPLNLTGEVGDSFQINLTTLPSRRLIIRYQHDDTAKAVYLEAWDATGTKVYDGVRTFTSATYSNDTLQLRGAGGTDGVSFGYFRIHTTILPRNSRMPLVSDNSNVLMHFKFDGNLSDSGPNGYSLSLSGPSYAPTPALASPVARIKAGAVTWSDWTSMRAGHPNTLDGTGSYSQADASGGVNCFWQVLSGPSTLRFSDRTSCAPTVTGAVFGDYHFQLDVTDSVGAKGTETLHVGAVATDDNGVVVNADPNVDKLFGPMIAFGASPWGYMDERAMTATKLRSAAYDAMGLNPPSWEIPRAGTVSYTAEGKTTTLSAGISATDMTMTLTDASQLDWSELPTRIIVGWPQEEIRICSQDGNTLTVCYDGRAYRYGAGYHGPASSWPSGTSVRQLKVSGTGTEFLKDFCPAGAGWNGTVSYSNGQIQVTPGSAVVTGVGTSWTGENAGGRAVRVEGRHGGAPFVFQAYVNSVDSATQLTLNRVFPPDADGGTLAYSIINPETRTITLHYTRTRDGSDAQIAYSTSGCESDTALYRYMWWDALRGEQTNQHYSYVDVPGYVGAYGVSFYGEDLAHYALYYRSGWTFARDAARKIGDYYVKSPQLAGGDGGGMALLYGGGVVGGVASAVLEGRTQWSDLRGFVKTGADNASLPCNAADTRDSSYLLMFLALGAVFDPDEAQRANWKSKLRNAYTRDNNCRGDDNSWSTGFYFNSANYPPLTATNGSAILTGANLPSHICLGKASGTLSVTPGSAEVTGTGFVPGRKVVIIGARNGETYVGSFNFQLNSSTSMTLSGLWPGDTSREASYVIEDNSSLGNDGNFMTNIATSESDPRAVNNWSCMWNSSSQITLNRPWVNPGGGSETVYLYKGNLAGRGQQPYMVGMKTRQMSYAALVDDPALAADYGALAALAAQWFKDNGYDPVTQGLYYGRGFGFCEPPLTPPASPLFDSRNPECNFGLNPGAIRAARVLTAEGSNALRVLYEASPTEANREWGDRAYGSIWGHPAYTTGGVYSDNNYVRDENSNFSLGAYKWTGFFFGMGMAHQWPAARLGGVRPALPATAYLDFNLANVASAAGVKVTVTQPSGARTEYSCSASPCAVIVDQRQGAHWVQMKYVSASGAVLAEGEPELLQVPCGF